jgi:lipopolysaccharide transport system permease protein
MTTSAQPQDAIAAPEAVQVQPPEAGLTGFVPTRAGERTVFLPYRPTLREGLVEAWRSRHLLWPLGMVSYMQVVRRYRLGPSWLVLNAFVSTIGFSIVFGGGAFNVPTPSGMPYFLFLITGMMGWRLFQTTLLRSMRAFHRMRRVTETLNVPLLLVPIAGSAQALFEFALYLLVYVGTLIYFYATKGIFYAQPSPRALAISVAGLALCLVLAWGIGFWVSAIYVWARDVRYVLTYLLTFWLFLTPVLYPIERLHGALRLVAQINPLGGAVEMVKVGLLGSGSVDVIAGVWSIASITVVFLSGIWFLNRFGHALIGTREGFDDDDEEVL